MKTIQLKFISILFSLILLISFATNAQVLPKKTLLALSKTDHVFFGKTCAFVAKEKNKISINVTLIGF